MKRPAGKGHGPLNNRLKAAAWGIKLAWRIDKKTILIWMGLSIFISALPAVALLIQQKIIASLSIFISAGTGEFADVVANIVLLGIILIFSGLSARLNDQLLYMMMFDTYYLGLEEVMMDTAQRIAIIDLVKKDTSDHFYSAIMRGGSLTDLMSSGCALVGKVTSIVTLMIVALGISRVIFLATLLYVVMIFIITFFYANETRLVWEETSKKIRFAESFEKLTRNNDAAKEIRMFENIETIKAHWQDAYQKISAAFIRRDTGVAKISLFGGLGFFLLMLAALAFSVLQVSRQQMRPDVLVLIYTLFVGLSGVVYAIPHTLQKVDYGLYGLDIQRTFFENVPLADPAVEARKADTPLDEEICFAAKGLTFAYNEGAPVLKDLSFSIRKGEIIALVGENGCGKTTLVKNLLGIYKPTSGTLEFMGRSYDEYKTGWIARQIGVFFQDFFLYHIPLGENVGIGDIGQIGNETLIREAMHRGGAEHLIGKYPGGLKAIINRQVYKSGVVLSGGEGQRVAVSRAHMSSRPILVFDEPASMLDPIAEMEQFFQIKNKIGGKTAVLVSHRIGFARLADRIFVLKKGEIVEAGTHVQLLAEAGAYAEMFHEQASWYDLQESKSKVED